MSQGQYPIVFWTDKHLVDFHILELQLEQLQIYHGNESAPPEDIIYIIGLNYQREERLFTTIQSNCAIYKRSSGTPSQIFLECHRSPFWKRSHIIF